MYIPISERISTQEVAQLVGVTSQTIRDWTNKGRSDFPRPCRVSRRVLYWRRSDILSFLGGE